MMQSPTEKSTEYLAQMMFLMDGPMLIAGIRENKLEQWLHRFYDDIPMKARVTSGITRKNLQWMDGIRNTWPLVDKKQEARRELEHLLEQFNTQSDATNRSTLLHRIRWHLQNQVNDGDAAHTMVLVNILLDSYAGNTQFRAKNSSLELPISITNLSTNRHTY